MAKEIVELSRQLDAEGFIEAGRFLRGAARLLYKAHLIPQSLKYHKEHPYRHVDFGELLGIINKESLGLLPDETKTATLRVRDLEDHATPQSWKEIIIRLTGAQRGAIDALIATTQGSHRGSDGYDPIKYPELYEREQQRLRSYDTIGEIRVATHEQMARFKGIDSGTANDLHRLFDSVPASLENFQQNLPVRGQEKFW